MSRLDGITDAAQRRHLTDKPWMAAEDCTCRTKPDGTRWYVCKHPGCDRPGRACGGYCSPCFARLGDEALMGPNLILGHQLLRSSAHWFPQIHERDRAGITTHLALGIAGEAGEVVDVLKKSDICGGLMDSCDLHPDGKHSVAKLADELGDLLTYLFELCALYGIRPEDAIASGQAKCMERWGTPPPRPPAPADYRMHGHPPP